MTFPTITIPDPAAVGKWLDEQLPSNAASHQPSFDGLWSVCHWYHATNYVYSRQSDPEALLADIRRQLADNDPLAKLRKEAEQHGFALMKIPTD